MGNEASSLMQRMRREKTWSAREKTASMSLQLCSNNSDVTALPTLYKKKARRISSTARFNNTPCSDKRTPVSTPVAPTLRTVESSPNMKEYRRSSVTRGLPPTVNTSASASNLLVPQVPGKDRRRSRSLCQTLMQNDVQEMAAKQGGGSRKGSSAGLVPQLNRLRIQQGFKQAKPAIGEMIVKRAAASRVDFRSFVGNLEEEQTTSLGEQTYLLISDAVENIERAEKVLSHACRYGETFVSLCSYGFRPDLFSVLADASIAECVRIDGSAHKRCDTLLAWSQLISAIFSSVRDGYYQRIRYQRRSSLPQWNASRQQSIDTSNPNSHASSNRGSQEKED